MAILDFYKKHRIVYILILVVVLVAAAAYIVYSREDAPKYVDQSVERGNIRSVVGATGTLTAITTTQVGTQVSGTISKWYADFNDHVKNGQLLADIEPSLFQAAYEQANANVKTSEADVVNQRANIGTLQAGLEKAKIGVRDAKIKLDRAQGMSDNGLIALSDLDVAKINYESAVASQRAAEAQLESARAQLVSSQARVAQAKANLSTAKVNLDHTKIYAPIDGVVVNRAIDVGQTVAASFQTPTLFTIANDLTKMQVFANIDEADVGRIREGGGSIFTVDAYPGEVFRGRIAQIRLNPTTISNVVTYTAVILVENPEMKLKPGMTANVTISVASRENVLKVPNAAVRFIPPQTDEEKKASAGTVRPTPSGGQQGGGQQGGGQQGAGQQAAGQQGASDRGRGQGSGGGGMGRFGGSRMSAEQKVWVIDSKTKKLRPVTVKLGITDGIFTELVEGPLQEGDRVVVAQQASGTARTGQQRPPGAPGTTPRPGGGGFR
ncbi:MAG: efflux RND transporter periplasmic adaptor subunit [Acidobacteriia bacterium]|nr:efflux RND transporter periplasmic adaptor subunit [Terriglobia bacterium]